MHKPGAGFGSGGPKKPQLKGCFFSPLSRWRTDPFPPLSLNSTSEHVSTSGPETAVCTTLRILMRGGSAELVEVTT
jgi:hypothetical protein